MLLWISSAMALLASASVLILLLKNDAKRHRKTKSSANILARSRALLFALAIAPAVVLAALGFYSSLLIWLGGITILGWVLALIPSKYL